MFSLSCLKKFRNVEGFPFFRMTSRATIASNQPKFTDTILIKHVTSDITLDVFMNTQ